MSSDVELSLGMDTTPFATAGKQAVAASETIGKQIAKKFEFKDLGRTLSTALGLNLQSIAEKLIQPFRDSADSAERIARYSDDAATATERLLTLRQTDLQQLSVMEKQLKRIYGDLTEAANRPPSKSFWGGLIERGSAIDKLFGLAGREDAARQEAIALKDKEAKEKSIEIEIKKADIKAKADAAAKKAIEERYNEEEKLSKATAERAKMDREDALAKMDNEKKLLSLRNELVAVQKKIADYSNFEKSGGKLTSEGVGELITLKEKEREVLKDINATDTHRAEVLERQRQAALTVGEALADGAVSWEAGQKRWNAEIEKTVDKFHEIVAAGEKLTRTGMQLPGSGDPAFARASDAELEEYARRLRAELERMSSNPGSAFNFGNSYGIANDKNLLNAIQGQLSLRNSLRFDASFGGVDYARQNFTGDPLKFDQLFQQFVAGQSEQQKQTVSLSNIERALVSTGIRTVPIGG